MTMKRLQLLCTLLLLAWCFTACGDRKAAEKKKETDTLPLLVMQIKQCSRLYTTELHLHKIVLHNDTKSLNGSILSKDFDVDLPLGTRKVAIPIDATVRAYIDFGNFSADNVNIEGKKIEIVLPDPKIAEPITKINHEEIKSYVPFLRRRFRDEELTSYELKVRQAIVEELPEMGIVEMAQASAARTLVPMIEQLGYRQEDITITFRKDLDRNDVTKMVERTVDTPKKTKKTRKKK